MDPQRWQSIKRILDDASRLAPEARSDYLDRACDGDPGLREEVASLLEYHDNGSVILDQPAFDLDPEDPFLGRRIGHYRIRHLLGRGGMGMVYLASREDDYSQEVAIKLIRRGLGSKETIARFHVERQILANLEHPSIARILDGGTTEEDGLPYLVMERVEGQPIDRYCDSQELDIRQRLVLFRDVLAAISTSHRHLVVHRDIKPGNVLVDATGRPKLIDFGIAKLLGTEDRGGLMAGGPQHRGPMSPRYASPEQVRGEPITTATDIYSLGVLLYELLCGRHPLAADTDRQEELEREICQSETVPPSAAMRSRSSPKLGGERPPRPKQELVARARGTSVTRLRRVLAGDLDAIVLKAMRKEPKGRYSSVDDLAKDIDAYLGGLPISAVDGSLAYRFGKFIRRNRLRLAVAGLASAVVVFFLVTVMMRSWAVRERTRAEAIGEFVEDLFWAAHPDRQDGHDLTVRELLNRGRGRLGEGLEDQPLVRAALLEVVGRVNKDLGNWDLAKHLLAEALELQRRHDPGDDTVMARYENELAIMLQREGVLDRAERLFRQALTRIGGCRSESPGAIWIAGNLAGLRIQQHDYSEADSLLDCLRERQESGLGSEAPALASILTKIGALRYNQHQFEDAETLFREALALRQKYHGELHTKVANALTNLGKVLHGLGKSSEAENMLLQALEIRSQLLDAEHPDIANTKINLAQVLTGLGKADAGADMARQALEILRSRGAQGSWRVAEAESVLGSSLAALEDCQEAWTLLDESLQVINREKGERSPYALAARQRIDRFDQQCGRKVER